MVWYLVMELMLKCLARSPRSFNVNNKITEKHNKAPILEIFGSRTN
jgi:hypothetical protein